MDNNNLEFPFSSFVPPLIVREGSALPLKERRPINSSGQITPAFDYVSPHPSPSPPFSPLFLFPLSSLLLAVRIDAHNHYQDVITGKLELSEQLKAFGINKDIERDTLDLATLFKMNRHWFKSTQEGMKFVTDLSNFEAKVDKIIHTHQDQKGNQKHLRSQAVNSNIPDKVTLNIPLFKGQPRVDIVIEVVVNPTNLNCALISPDLKMVIETQTEEVIMEQVDKIKSIVPNSPILFE
jgi:hypothetical protein